MSQSAVLHESGQRIILLAPTTIGAAVAATATTAVLNLSGSKYLAFESVFLYGAGGTTVDAYLQTSLDGGLSWIDIANHNFTTAAASKVSAVSVTVALAAGITPTDGSLASNTILNGLLGGRIRLKWVTVGTYTGATSLACYAIIKG